MNAQDQALLDRVTAVFTEQFGHAPDLVVRAPGRVNLIGEHTDYNDGFVLPCAIGPANMVAISKRDDDRVDVVAADFDDARDSFALIPPPERNLSQPWADYVRGTLLVLQNDGHALSGAKIAIAGNLPKGAGLSSSAALAVAVGKANLALNGIDIDNRRLAQIAQKAECDFVGTQCGIMDQLISAQGKADHALLIDCRSLEVTDILIPDDVAIMIVHSGVTRGLVDGHYNDRRRQCEAAAAAMGVSALRDADLDNLAAANLDAVTTARARHVITENQRTLDAADALAKNDLVTLGMLMAQSHASMRDDFEITIPAIDDLVALLQNAIGDQGGTRMTGGGFGGAAVAIMPRARVADVQASINAAYKTPNGDAPLIMIERPGPGVAIL
ncbi:galactokinase [Sphingorhabdus sp.]|jgi:galactokinase|uniref:galactokinase n=1 Tax=Sphingorhabdus sp. TaxID=1902408 RepID=UPI003783DEFD